MSIWTLHYWHSNPTHRRIYLRFFNQFDEKIVFSVLTNAREPAVVVNRAGLSWLVEGFVPIARDNSVTTPFVERPGCLTRIWHNAKIWREPWGLFNIKMSSYQHRNSDYKVRRPWDHRIFTMGILYLLKLLILQWGPGYFLEYTYLKVCILQRFPISKFSIICMRYKCPVARWLHLHTSHRNEVVCGIIIMVLMSSNCFEFDLISLWESIYRSPPNKNTTCRDKMIKTCSDPLFLFHLSGVWIMRCRLIM